MADGVILLLSGVWVTMVPGFENVSPTVFAFPDHRATEKLTTCVDVGMNSRKLGVIMSSWIYNDVLF